MRRLAIRYANHPLYCTATSRWLDGVLVEIAQGRYVVETGDQQVLAVHADGSYSYDAAGIHAPLNRCFRDPTINLLRFVGSGIPFAVPYCAAAAHRDTRGRA
jgi:hypothetical protein